MGDLVEVDPSAWPIVVVRMPAQLDMPAIDSFIRGVDAVLERKASFVTIVDTTALSRLPNALERRALIDQMNKRTFAESSHSLGSAVVIVSKPARAVLTAINWVRPPVVTQHLVGTFDDALAWCRRRLAQAGIELAPQVRAALERQRTGTR